MSTDEKSVALITGGSLRLGAETAKTLAQAGYRVAIHYRSSHENAQDLAATIIATHGADSARLFKADLTNEGECAKLPGVVASAMGRLDLLVNNASIFSPTERSAINSAAFRKFGQIHVTAPALLSYAAIPLMALNGAGHIVNIIDIYASFAKPGFTPYVVSKAGLKSLTRQLAVELAPQNIMVNGVAPGAILDPLPEAASDTREEIIRKIPLGRFGAPSDIAHTILFLAQAEYITGQIIVVDGGRSLTL